MLICLTRVLDQSYVCHSRLLPYNLSALHIPMMQHNTIINFIFKYVLRGALASTIAMKEDSEFIESHRDPKRQKFESSPNIDPQECCILEQFPPTDDFHIQQNSNRPAVLPQNSKVFLMLVSLYIYYSVLNSKCPRTITMR